MRDLYMRSVNKLAYILINAENIDYDLELDRYGNVVFILEDTQEVRRLKERYEMCIAEGLNLEVDLVKFLDKCREIKTEMRELKANE
ncbi:hypothetical protein [Sarcina ventriculi]|uniref:hypothetical protein n=1 Tax=Sarcina ventriculi TaxID=1267 RepID=UPI001C0F44D4|nr:hypothetical protein [Sarcina ventriculi]MBU5323394.1 hypothetical protein [Sarcina ventriculi]